MMQTGATEKLRSPNLDGLLIITVANNGESSSFAELFMSTKIKKKRIKQTVQHIFCQSKVCRSVV